MAASATFALKAGVWFRRGRLLIISPDSQGTASPLSGRNSTYRPVQILEAGSDTASTKAVCHTIHVTVLGITIDSLLSIAQRALALLAYATLDRKQALK